MVAVKWSFYCENCVGKKVIGQFRAILLVGDGVGYGRAYGRSQLETEK